MDSTPIEIEQLRAAIKTLAAENAQLSERAEDLLQFGLMADAIERCTEPLEIIHQTLEKIAVLKKLPFASCGLLREGAVEKIASYTARA